MLSKDLNKPSPSLSSKSVDVIKILGEPKARSSICPPEEKFLKVTSRSRDSLVADKNTLIKPNKGSSKGNKLALFLQAEILLREIEIEKKL